MNLGNPAAVAAVSLLLSAPLAAAPPDFDVVVTNGEGQPVPVAVQAQQPVFYRVVKNVFGDSTDASKTVAVTERVVLYDLSAETTAIHQYAGCYVNVAKREGGPSGPLTWLFEVEPFDKDLSAQRDGQITQQRLGRGVLFEPGDEILIQGGGITNPDVPVAGPDHFCSAQVQLFGEVLPN